MDILRELTSQRQVRDLKGRVRDEMSLTSVLARASICFGTAHCSLRFCGCWICQMLFFFFPYQKDVIYSNYSQDVCTPCCLVLSQSQGPLKHLLHDI